MKVLNMRRTAQVLTASVITTAAVLFADPVSAQTQTPSPTPVADGQTAASSSGDNVVIPNRRAENPQRAPVNQGLIRYYHDLGWIEDVTACRVTHLGKQEIRDNLVVFFSAGPRTPSMRGPARAPIAASNKDTDKDPTK